jgi:propanol-preferring alcohol dehydrogenase
MVSTEPLRRVRESPPRPAAGELLVRVLACGVCRTDLHVTEGDLPVHRLGVVPGHEVVGEVIGFGDAGAGELEVGQRVGIAWRCHTCRRCRYCTRGSENLCPHSEYTDWDADGGYADYTTVPALAGAVLAGITVGRTRSAVLAHGPRTAQPPIHAKCARAVKRQ